MTRTCIILLLIIVGMAGISACESALKVETPRKETLKDAGDDKQPDDDAPGDSQDYLKPVRLAFDAVEFLPLDARGNLRIQPWAYQTRQMEWQITKDPNKTLLQARVDLEVPNPAGKDGVLALRFNFSDVELNKELTLAADPASGNGAELSYRPFFRTSGSNLKPSTKVATLECKLTSRTVPGSSEMVISGSMLIYLDDTTNAVSARYALAADVYLLFDRK